MNTPAQSQYWFYDQQPAITNADCFYFLQKTTFYPFQIPHRPVSARLPIIFIDQMHGKEDLLADPWTTLLVGFFQLG